MSSSLLRTEGRLGSFRRLHKASRRRFSPDFLPLEGRTLLSGGLAPTNEEQYMLELVNRARANPSAEGQRLLAITQSDPLIQSAVAGWDLNAFLQQMNSSGPLPPLAFNTRLIEAAHAQDAAMVDANTQVHSPPGFLTNPAVAQASDGQAYYPIGGSSWATGENVFAYSAGVGSSSLKDYANYFHEGFLLDWGNPSFGHLKNLMAPGPGEAAPGGRLPYSEIGIGLINNVNPTSAPGIPGLDVGPAVVTQEFAWHSTGQAILTGVVFVDNNHDQFYSPGEGLGGQTITAVGRNGQGTFQVQTWGSGGYSLPLPAGTYDVTASGNALVSRSTVVTIGQDNVAWDVSATPQAAPQQTPPPSPQADIPVPGDYDGLGRAEMALYRPSTGQWFINSPVTGTRTVSFGMPNVDIPVPASYDGTHRTDIAVFRPTTGQWFIVNSTTGRVYITQFWATGDIPVPRDYDGVGRADLAIFRPSTAQWAIIHSSGAANVFQFGAPGDFPTPADFDGDGKVDLAIFRPSTGVWGIIYSSHPAAIVQYGLPGDIPVPRDYDGVGHAEIAVFRPSSDQWWIIGPRGPAQTPIQFGVPGQDLPEPANLLGDGRADLVTYRPATAEWAVSGLHTAYLSQFGQGGTGPAPTPWLNASMALLSAPAAQEDSGTAGGTGPRPTLPHSVTTTVDPAPNRPLHPGSQARPWDAFRRHKHRHHASGSPPLA